MAQKTKRKRRTKHRGTAAGTIEVRGRTGRKPTAAEKKGSERDQARERRLARLDTPPTWASAAKRSLFAVAFFFIALVFLFKRPIGAAAGLAAVMVLIYIPMGFYTDQFLYRRRQAKKAVKSKTTKR
ncbi:MAG TPA: hypothetical protein VHE14_09245 [Solirubrobacteraceae bacterium]|nr:hypothetical protein [Solirubrobacteraceae bacterium]